MIRIPILIAQVRRIFGPGLFAGALLTGVVVAAAPALAAPRQQSDDDEPPSVSHAVVEPTAPSAGRALNAALERLARDPRNVDALLDAGNAALTLGDNEAALGFFTRADQFSPANASVKIAIAGARLHLDDPVAALRWYADAERSGGDPAGFALDRGLAYDLVGDNAAAVAQYRKVLERSADPAMRDEATRREAISLAIGGDRRAADLALLPLLQRQDRAAWRAHIFVLAIAGRSDEAVAVARATMPPDLAEAIAPYLRFMVRLTPAQQAAVASLGRFPRAADIGRDDPRVAAYTAAHPRVLLAPAAAPAPTLAQAAAPMPDTKSRRRRGQPVTPVKVAVTAPASAEADIALPPPPPPPPTSAALAYGAAPPVVSGVGRTTTQARNGFDLGRVSGSNQAQAPAPAISPVVPRPTVLSRLDMPPPTHRASVAPAGAPEAGLARAAPVAVSHPVVEPVPEPAAPGVAPQVPAPAPAATATTPGIVAVELPPAIPEPAAATSVPASHAVVEPIPPAPEKAPERFVAPKPVHVRPVEAPVDEPAAARPGKDKSGKDQSARDKSGKEVRTKAGKDKAGNEKAGKEKAGKEKADEAVDAAEDTRSGKDKVLRSKSAHGKQAKDDDADVAPAPCKPVSTARGRKGKAASEDHRAVAKGRSRHAGKGKKDVDNDTCAPTLRGERPDGPGDVSRDSDSDDSRAAKGKAKGKSHDKTADSEKTSEKGGRHARYASRIWVEVLTGNDRDKMPGEWRTLVRKAHALKKHKPYLTPWRSNFRLLTGPFDSDADAQDFIAELRKDGVSGFEWTSPAGQAVDSLALP